MGHCTLQSHPVAEYLLHCLSLDLMGRADILSVDGWEELPLCSPYVLAHLFIPGPSHLQK